MKKINVIAMENSRSEMLEKLCDLGVLHVQHVTKPEGRRIDILKDMWEIIHKAQRVLSKMRPSDATGPWEHGGLSLANRVNGFMERRKRMEEGLRNLRVEAERLSPLGDFDPKEIHELETQGVFIQLYSCRKKQLAGLSQDTAYFVVSGTNKDWVVAIVSRKKETPLSLKPFPLPTHSIVDISSMIQQKEEELIRMAKELRELSSGTKLLSKTLSDIEQELEFERVALGMGGEEPLSYIQGYCPAPEIRKLEKSARENSWGLLIQDPAEKDAPPTLIKNPRWINIISPVFKLLNTLPGYREFDISLGFLIYLGLFFAVLIGDAGYGALFLAATACVHLKFQNIPREPVYLMYFFSAVTLIWGAIIGNWFGLESLSGIPFFNIMIIPSLYAFSTESQDSMMMFCFIIGASHLSIAHLLLAFSVINTLKALAQAGWIMIIWGMLFLVRHLVLGFSIPSFPMVLLWGGMGLVVFFTAPQRNIIKAVGIGLAKLPMKTINCFSDTVSYIRLFAVGMVTLAVAASFNTMAAELGFETPLQILGSTLILVAGHGLNIIMAALAIIVHGVRLNMLEFSGHLDMEWSGYEYKPFEKNSH